MNTGDIADILELTAKLMELHETNPFKVKAVSNAAYKLSKTRINLEGKSLEELEQIEGIGKGIAAKIHEILNNGTTQELEELREKTPDGVIEVMGIKGLGPKKVRQLWQELGIESIGELLYACNENRLVDLKGFGAKTQESIKQNIEFTLKNANKFHYAAIESYVEQILELLNKNNNGCRITVSGDYRRKCEVIDKLVFIHTSANLNYQDDATKLSPVPVEFIATSENDYEKTLFETTASKEHLEIISYTNSNLTDEKEIYQSLGLSYLEPELRENLPQIIDAAKKNAIPTLITDKDLKGILHNHSTYSDGMHSLEEMAVYCKELGYEYLGICDHSQSAFYANGLKPDVIEKQHKEIEKLNKALAPFKIFKGIESDILNDGNLDYEKDVLSSFDFIVASVHSNLKMNEEKANQRLIKAIENPFTTILGHPTGRLLLARNGYPIDHKKIIDACAANGVIIELNAHPYRLDIDWRWIPYCLEKGVKISINPDAHQKEGYADMKYGVNVARKGMLTKENCFNALSLQEIEAYFNIRKSKV
ncbi:MAG: DNA polymerase/3'-5' exonuclease PolX [Bacteroidetes bacterium]|nr:DNA polymerase/3'-5' exonuclease PolX [Bacteroidota bacterium]